MKRWKKLVAVIAAAAGIATTGVAAVSAGGEVRPAAPPESTSGLCEHHAAGTAGMHESMATGMMGGMMAGAAGDMQAPHEAHHDGAGDVTKTAR